jgi:acyl-CoA hydrolase
MSVHVNGFKLMSSEYTVTMSEGAMSSIVFHVPMYIGDAVCVSGMKKVVLQS